MIIRRREHETFTIDWLSVNNLTPTKLDREAVNQYPDYIFTNILTI